MAGRKREPPITTIARRAPTASESETHTPTISEASNIREITDAKRAVSTCAACAKIGKAEPTSSPGRMNRFSTTR